VQSLLIGRHIGAVASEAQTAFNLPVALPAAHATKTARTMPRPRSPPAVASLQSILREHKVRRRGRRQRNGKPSRHKRLIPVMKI
jgi:transcriptional regulator of nitric oxide reductase